MIGESGSSVAGAFLDYSGVSADLTDQYCAWVDMQMQMQDNNQMDWWLEGIEEDKKMADHRDIWKRDQ